MTATMPQERRIMLPEPPLDLPSDAEYLTVTDVKNHAHCARFTFYEQCWPAVRPRTYKMDAGDEAHEQERERARRRTLRAYDLPAGERHFAVRVACPRLRLRGEIDEMVITPEGGYLPVDYKLSTKVNESFAAQITAYAMLVESQYGVRVETGYIYLLIPRTMVRVVISAERREEVRDMLARIRGIMDGERMPPPVKARAKCRDCEFRLFCNDV